MKKIIILTIVAVAALLVLGSMYENFISNKKIIQGDCCIYYNNYIPAELEEVEHMYE